MKGNKKEIPPHFSFVWLLTVQLYMKETLFQVKNPVYFFHKTANP